MYRFIILVCLFIPSGCVHYRPPPVTATGPIVERLSDKYFNPTVEKRWLEEIGHKYSLNNCYVFMCHGGYDETKKYGSSWYYRPNYVYNELDQPVPADEAHDDAEPVPPGSIQQKIMEIRTREPHRTIVIVSCNPGRVRLQGPQYKNVVYATTSVWITPDAYVDPKFRRFLTFWEQFCNALSEVTDSDIQIYREAMPDHGLAGTIWDFVEASGERVTMDVEKRSTSGVNPRHDGSKANYQPTLARPRGNRHAPDRVGGGVFSPGPGDSVHIPGE